MLTGLLLLLGLQEANAQDEPDRASIDLLLKGGHVIDPSQ